MKTLVLGLGNPILTDDSVGIRIANSIRDQCKDIQVTEAPAAGFRIIDEIIGYDKLLVIDSIKTGQAKPGTVFRYSVDDFRKTRHFSSPHDISFFEALDIVAAHGEKIPAEIIIYAIEVEDTCTFSECCTTLVETAIPSVTRQIISEQGLSIG